MGGGEMVNDDSISPPSLGLRSLAESVHDIRIDVGTVADEERGPVVCCGETPPFLSGEPLLCAVSAKVYNGIRPELILQPEVEGDVLVVGRELFIVVEYLFILQPPPGRLRGGKDHVPEGDGGGDYQIVLSAGVVDHDLSGRFTPFRDHFFLFVQGGELVEPCGILCGREQDDIPVFDHAVELSGSPCTHISSLEEHQVKEFVFCRHLAVDGIASSFIASSRLVRLGTMSR